MPNHSENCDQSTHRGTARADRIDELRATTEVLAPGRAARDCASTTATTRRAADASARACRLRAPRRWLWGRHDRRSSLAAADGSVSRRPGRLPCWARLRIGPSGCCAGPGSPIRRFAVRRLGQRRCHAGRSLGRRWRDTVHSPALHQGRTVDLVGRGAAASRRGTASPRCGAQVRTGCPAGQRRVLPQGSHRSTVPLARSSRTE